MYNSADYITNVQNNTSRSVIVKAQGKLKGKLYESQGGLSGLSPLRSDSSHDNQAGS